MRFFIDNITAYTPTYRIDNAALLTDGPQIVALGPRHAMQPPAKATRINGQGGFLIPGLIDLQINGGFGHDLTSDPTSLWQIARQLPQTGVTSFLPTRITAPLADLPAALETLLAGPPPQFSGAIPLGWHLEGPFLNPAKPGAHPPHLLQPPNLPAVENWSPATGVRLVTLAPELPNAHALITQLTEQGVQVSAGHSAANYAQGQAALAAGIKMGTHLPNAMPPILSREPGLAGALLDSNAYIALIADGHHLHPAMLKLLISRIEPQRLILVTDATAPLLAPPGSYPLGHQTIIAHGQKVTLADGASLAGTATPAIEILRYLRATLSTSPTRWLPAFTSNPSRLLGLSTTLGQLAPATRADMVLLTPEWQVQHTWVAGELVFTPKHGPN